MAHVIWALRKYPVRTFLWLKIFKSARRGLNLWVQIKHLGSISSGQISKWTQRNFGLDQPTSLSEARGWRDRGKSTTLSKARDLMNLGPPLISSEARGLIGREAFWVLVNLKTSSEVRGWMGVCQLSILSEASGLVFINLPPRTNRESKEVFVSLLPRAEGEAKGLGQPFNSCEAWG